MINTFSYQRFAWALSLLPLGIGMPILPRTYGTYSSFEQFIVKLCKISFLYEKEISEITEEEFDKCDIPLTIGPHTLYNQFFSNSLSGIVRNFKIVCIFENPYNRLLRSFHHIKASSRNISKATTTEQLIEIILRNDFDQAKLKDFFYNDKTDRFCFLLPQHEIYRGDIDVLATEFVQPVDVLKILNIVTPWILRRCESTSTMCVGFDKVEIDKNLLGLTTVINRWYSQDLKIFTQLTANNSMMCGRSFIKTFLTNTASPIAFTDCRHAAKI
jgi:hypothetical protein